MRADEPHRLARRRAQRRQAEPLDDGVEDRLRRFAGMDDAGGDAERPSRSRDEQSRRFDVAVEPAAGGELVLDQPVGGRGIGHAQQRLGQHHQRQALLGRERVSVQKVFDPAEAAGLGADRFDQRSRARVDAVFGCGVAHGAGSGKPAANSSSGGAYGARNVSRLNVGELDGAELDSGGRDDGRLAAKSFIAGSASLVHTIAAPPGWPAACILRRRGPGQLAARELRPRTTRLKT